MRISKLLAMVALAATSGLLVPFLLPVEEARAASWGLSASAAVPNFLASSASFSMEALAPPAAPAVPSSVIPHTQRQCSTNTTAPSGFDTKCSVFPNTQSNRCSAVCGAGQRCSSFSYQGEGVNGLCSTHGKEDASCSVLISKHIGSGVSRCSAFGMLNSQYPTCSIFDSTLQAHQFCSAQNGKSLDYAECSAGGFLGSNSSCSVLRAYVGPNQCSVLNHGAKKCSVFYGGTKCSIYIIGTCTNLQGAASGSCSAHSWWGHCSHMWGSAGTYCSGD